jgi:hypothetical protein
MTPITGLVIILGGLGLKKLIFFFVDIKAFIFGSRLRSVNWMDSVNSWEEK